MMTITVVYVLCGFLAGALIGTVGIGGVILVPLLIYLAGASVHQSVAAAIFSFLVSGLVGTIIYARRGVIEWPLVKSLTIGAVPGTLMGTFLLFYLDALVLKIFIALITILSALRELLVLRNSPKILDFYVSNQMFIVVGFFTGGLSALSGTGGPLILIPALMMLSAPMLLAVGLSQVIQIPVAIFATLGNVWNGLMDWHMALSIASGVAMGSFIGGQLSKSIPVRTIKKFVAALLLFSGVWMVSSLLF